MANIQWLGGISGLFSDATKWAGGVIPGTIDAAQINAIGPYVVTSDSNWTVNELTMVAATTIDVTNFSLFKVQANSAADGLAGSILVEDGSTLSLGGTINNTGIISLLATSANTVLLFNTIPTVLTGAGSVVLSNNAANILTGALTNTQFENVNNVISGAGDIGNNTNKMVLTNDAAGVIDANQPSALILDTSSNVIANQGTLEATAGGQLTINSQVNNAGGTILAAGAGSVVTINAPVIGGTVKTSGGGVVIYNTNNNVSLNGQGTHPYTITAGTNLQIANGNSAYLAGVISNKGTISLNSTTSSPGAGSKLIAASGFVTLQGHGLVQMSNNVNNLFYSSNGNFTLTNVDNTISGAGVVGSSYRPGSGNSMLFINDGIVNANQGTPLYISTSNQVVNAGTFEATSGGDLAIYGQTVLNTGGTILAKGAGSTVDLDSSNILGGMLKTLPGGMINGADGRLDGSITGGGGAVTIAAGTSVLISDQSDMKLNGAIVNMGTITLNQTSATGSTWLYMDGAATSLSGGGKVVLADNTAAGGDNNNIIMGNGYTRSYKLTNVDNVIIGAGNLGNGYMTFENQAGGVVNASSVAALNVDTAGQTLINAGVMKATNHAVANGGLRFIDTGISNGGGTLLSSGANSHVDLIRSTVYGGTLASIGGGAITTRGDSIGNGWGAGLDGTSAAGAVNNTGLFDVWDSTILWLNGAINNTGTILLDGQTNSNTDIRVSGSSAMLSGGGKVTLTNNDNNRLWSEGYNRGYTLINANNTISGTGQLGNAYLALVNQAGGTINANNDPIIVGAVASTGALVVNTQGETMVNAGLLEATATGGLVIRNTGVSNSGTVLANGLVTPNAHVDLQGGTIMGGVVKTLGTAVIRTLVGSSGGFDGTTNGPLAIAAASNVQVSDLSSLALTGSIVNNGTINLAGVSTGGSFTDIIVNGSATLSGGGRVVMTNDTNNRIWSGNYSRSYVLDNVDNTITGSGQIGAAYMTFVNEAGGTVLANQAPSFPYSGQLILNTQGVTAVNRGIIKDTGLGGLVIQNTAINNQGGTILAAGTGAHVDLLGGTIMGGLVTTGANAVVQTGPGPGNAGGLDGVTYGQLTNGGNIIVNDQDRLDIAGAIANTGKISLNQFSASGNTDLQLTSQNVTLSGGGQILMSNSGANRIYGANATFKLINVDNTVRGAGNIGIGQMQLDNSGVIVADQTAALWIDTGNRTDINEANGVMSATALGGLELHNGIFANYGTLAAYDGSSVYQNQNYLYNTNNSGGELYQGTWIVSAAGHGALMQITGGAVSKDSAVITLDGAGSAFQAWNGATWVNLENSLTDISAADPSIPFTGGVLNITGGRGFTSTTAITDEGTLRLGGGTFQTANLTVTTSGLLSGNGIVQNAIANSGVINASGGTLTVTGNVGGSGSLRAAPASELVLNGVVNSAGAVIDNGTIALGASASLTVTGAVGPASTGVFLLNNASLLEVAADTGNANRMSFIGPAGATLAVDAVASFGSNIGQPGYTGPLLQSFGIGDQIDLKDFNFPGASITSYTPATGLLQLTSGGAKATLMFEDSSLGGGVFAIGNDGSGHVLLTHG